MLTVFNGSDYLLFYGRSPKRWVYDADGDEDLSTVEWVFGNYIVGTNNDLNLGVLGVFRGDSLVCNVTPNDGTEDGDTLSMTVTVDNSPPTISDLGLDPPRPNRSDQISADFFAYDVDGDRPSPGRTSGCGRCGRHPAPPRRQC